MEDVVAAKNRVADNAPEEVFQQPLAACNRRGILLGLGLPFDSIVGNALFGGNRWDDEDGVQALKSLVQAQEGRISPASGVCLASVLGYPRTLTPRRIT